MGVEWGSSSSLRRPHPAREWLRGLRHLVAHSAGFLPGRAGGGVSPWKVDATASFSEHARALVALRELPQVAADEGYLPRRSSAALTFGSAGAASGRSLPRTRRISPRPDRPALSPVTVRSHANSAAEATP